MNEKLIAKRVAGRVIAASPKLTWNIREGSNDPWEVAREAGINILSDKDFTAGYVVDGEFIAVLFSAADNDGYSFDIAVLPQWQRKGLGTKLLDLAIDDFDQYEEAYGPDFGYKLDVVNSHMVRVLKRRGFVITDKFGGHTLMTKE